MSELQSSLLLKKQLAGKRQSIIHTCSCNVPVCYIHMYVYPYFSLFARGIDAFMNVMFIEEIYIIYQGTCYMQKQFAEYRICSISSETPRVPSLLPVCRIKYIVLCNRHIDQPPPMGFLLWATVNEYYFHMHYLFCSSMEWFLTLIVDSFSPNLDSEGNDLGFVFLYHSHFVNAILCAVNTTSALMNIFVRKYEML